MNQTQPHNTPAPEEVMRVVIEGVRAMFAGHNPDKRLKELRKHFGDAAKKLNVEPAEIRQLFDKILNEEKKMKDLFVNIEKIRELLGKDFELVYHVVEKGGKFFGGNSGGSEIWRDNPSLAYHFAEGDAKDFAKLLPGAMVRTVNAGRCNICDCSFHKFVASIPLTEEEKEAVKIYDELSAAITKWGEDTSFALKKVLTETPELHYYYSLKAMTETAGFACDHTGNVRINFDVGKNVINVSFRPAVNHKTAVVEKWGGVKVVPLTEVEMQQSDFVCQWVADRDLAKKLNPTIMFHNNDTGQHYRWDWDSAKRVHIPN